MSLPISQVFAPALAADWLTALLSAASTVGLDTTSWQSGGAERTELVVTSQSLSQEDGIASTWAQGGFLDYAATGTVTYTAANGQQTTVPVTPAGGPGLLDVLASSVYNVTRVPATFASGTLAITNASASSYGPFAAGTFHVANGTNKATYTNQSSLTIAPNATTNAVIVADAIGTAGSSPTGQITTLVTSLVGVTITNALALNGQAVETNVALANRCRLKLAAQSPNGPKNAYAFVALSATQAPYNATLTQAITRQLVTLNVANGVVTVTVANGSGPVTGIVGAAITGVASNGGPNLIRVTIGNTTGISTGSTVTIAGVQGVPLANGTFVVTVIDGTRFDLQGTAFSGAYISGGTVEGGDLGQLDNAIQNFVVPSGDTEVTQSATANNIAVVATVWAPAAFSSTVTSDVTKAVTNYFAAVPIGGYTLAVPTQLPFDGVLGAIFEGATYLQQATLTLNGGTADITLGATDIPVASPAIVVVVHLV
jgi:hypothetical protein